MIEVEVKIPVGDVKVLVEGLLARGFVKEGSVLEEDRYYDNEAGQIAASHQALRIRRNLDQETGFVSYQLNFKDKKMDDISMTRPEHEIEIQDAAALERILNGLGFYGVEPGVRKVRQFFTLGQVTACVDQVEGLGSFLELEEVIPDSEDEKYALAGLEKILRDLGLSLKDSTRKSYLSQLRDRN